MPLKFIQIVTSSWRSNPNQLNITVYGLTKSGEVYKFVASKNGWVPLPMNSMEPALVSKPKGKKQQNEEEPW
jgi:hypothetical protein